MRRELLAYLFCGRKWKGEAKTENKKRDMFGVSPPYYTRRPMSCFKCFPCSMSPTLAKGRPVWGTSPVRRVHVSHVRRCKV